MDIPELGANGDESFIVISQLKDQCLNFILAHGRF